MSDATPPPAPNSSDRSIEDTLEQGGPEEIKELFEEAHPADLADALEELEDDRWDEVLAEMPAQKFGQIIEHIPATDAVEHLSRSNDTYRQEALAELPDDELVDLLQEFPDHEREVYVELLPEEQKVRSRQLLAYPETSAGGRMTTEIATVEEEMTIRQAIEKLSGVKETSELLARIYVVDEQGRLKGKLRLRDLTFNPRSVLIKDVMDQDLLSIDAYADQEEAARMISKYDLLALPVVDADRRILGVVTHDDAIEILEEESTEDFEKLSGIQASDPDETYLRTPVLSHFRRRVGWVVTMAFLAISSGFVLYKFEHSLSAVPVLALYITMVVAAGGNTGSQAATMVIRAMSLGEFQPKDFLEVIWKELRIGVLVGLCVGIAIYLQINILTVGEFPSAISAGAVAITVGLALMMQIITSTVLGASLPQIARACNVDPAAVASPVITTVVDVTGLVIYFMLAKAFLGI